MASSSDERIDSSPPTVVKVEEEEEEETTSNTTSLELLPSKTRDRYDYTYNQFMKWRTDKGVSSFSENTLLAYFAQMSEKVAPTTLWTQYSMLRSTLVVHHNVNIAQYMKLRMFLKRKSTGYKPQKTKTLTTEDINRFINKASDDIYLLHKVVLIIGVSGACGKQELFNLKIDNIEDLNSAALITIGDKNKQRRFSLAGEFYEKYKKYAALRPTNLKERRFFLSYRNKKCIKQPVGINKFGNIPKQIATYLGLKDPGAYVGHCFKRSSATIFSKGAWQSTTSAPESYSGESLESKIEVAKTVLNFVNETPATSQLPGNPASCTVLLGAGASPPTLIKTEDPSPINVSTVSEHNLQNSQLPVNFYNCSNMHVTINFYNNVKQ